MIVSVRVCKVVGKCVRVCEEISEHAKNYKSVRR
ncbi:hypothetical protein ANAPC4_01438 [Anaplasma phagocytophilum]|nr:hypothetical protein ANAPC4_01438 [Anaplasma phagocytophilum]